MPIQDARSDAAGAIAVGMDPVRAHRRKAAIAAEAALGAAAEEAAAEVAEAEVAVETPGAANTTR